MVYCCVDALLHVTSVSWVHACARVPTATTNLLVPSHHAGPGPLSTAQQQPAYVAQAVGVLALIIAVHEAGHFTAARVQVKIKDSFVVLECALFCCVGLSCPRLFMLTLTLCSMSLVMAAVHALNPVADGKAKGGRSRESTSSIEARSQTW
jgi:hypothetical protein